MTHSKRSSTLTQLAAAMVAFAVSALLLESGGLYDWAQRLDLGPLRTVALPVATKLHAAVARTGLETVRAKAITGLARAGWGDDPAAAENGGATADPTATTVTLPVPSPTKPGVVPESKLGPVTPPVIPPPLTPLAGDPPLTSTLPPLADTLQRAQGRPLVVALAGDSMMAVGLAEMLLRQSPKYPNIKFVKAFKSGTGLARPEVFNWQKEYPAMLGTVHPDVVLVAIGANDGQGFVDNGVTYPFGSDGWKTVYQQRVAAYLQMIAQPASGGHAPQVLWLSLPPMKSENYSAKISLVNRIAYTVVSASPQAAWFSTAGIEGDYKGAFRDFGEVNGKQTRLRASDGIHMSIDGATLIADKLFPWLSPAVSTPVEPAKGPH